MFCPPHSSSGPASRVGTLGETDIISPQQILVLTVTVTITMIIGTYLMTGDVGNVVLLYPHISGISSGNVHSYACVHLPKLSQFLA